MVATLEKVKVEKFSIDKKDLLEGLEATAKVVPQKPSHPVLANIVFSIKQQLLTLKAFDLSRSLEMRCTVDADSDLQLEFCISASIKDLVAKLKDGEIKIEYNPETHEVTFKQGKSKHKRNGMSSAEFPTLPEVNGTKLALIGEVLSNAFSRVTYAASLDETNQILTSVNLQSANSQLKFAATDGHRLACFSTSETVEDGLNLNIPSKAIQDIMKLLNKASSLNFEVSESQLKLETDQWVSKLRLLEGQYPNYEQLIPKQFAAKAQFDKSEFISCLERVLLIADQKNGIVVVDLDNDILKISADVPDHGESVEEMECSGNSELRIAFNGKYLLDAVKNTSGDSINVESNTSTSPVVITGNDSARFLVMPVQIRS